MEGFIKTFLLERMVGTPVQPGYFHNKPKDYYPETYWKNIYGITVPPGGKPENVDLRFSYQQGRYFETTPFFTPFGILEKTPEYLTVRLHLIPNGDLVQKLASLGDGVKVLQPLWYAEKVWEYLRHALERYDEQRG